MSTNYNVIISINIVFLVKILLNLEEIKKIFQSEYENEICLVKIDITVPYSKLQ